MRLEKDFAEFVRLLNKHKVKYLIVGAYAVSFYARPRYTSDIDFLVEPARENIRRLLRVLKDFGFGGIGLKEEDFLDPDMVVQLGREPVRIDILSSLEGVDFGKSYKSKVRGKFGRLPRSSFHHSDLGVYHWTLTQTGSVHPSEGLPALRFIIQTWAFVIGRCLSFPRPAHHTLRSFERLRTESCATTGTIPEESNGPTSSGCDTLLLRYAPRGLVSMRSPRCSG